MLQECSRQVKNYTKKQKWQMINANKIYFKERNTKKTWFSVENRLLQYWNSILTGVKNGPFQAQRHPPKNKTKKKPRHQNKQETLKKPMSTIRKLRDCSSGLELTLNQGQTQLFENE